MKKLARNALWVMLAFVKMTNAATLTAEQNQAAEFIQKMYSYSAGAFEFGYFQGKYEPDRQCLLMEEFFLKKLIPKPEKDQGCDIGTRRYIRYPGVGDIELSESKKMGQMPRPKLSIPLIEGDKARVEAKDTLHKSCLSCFSARNSLIHIEPSS